MIRLVVALFIVVNVIVALLFMGEGNSVDGNNATGSLPADSGDQLILLSEIDSTELAAVEQSPPEPEPELFDVSEPVQPEPVVEMQMCVLSGPFASEARARELGDRIGALGVEVDFLTETTEEPGSIMVYTGPFASAQQAQRELRVLQSSGVDSFVVADGELEDAISLGVFRTRENARTQQDRIEQLGYQTQVYQYMVENDQYYVNFSGRVLAAITSDYWANIANEYKDISIEQKACNEVASSGNFH